MENGKKISELPGITQLTGNEEIPVEVGGKNGRIKSGMYNNHCPPNYLLLSNWYSRTNRTSRRNDRRVAGSCCNCGRKTNFIRNRIKV